METMLLIQSPLNQKEEYKSILNLAKQFMVQLNNPQNEKLRLKQKSEVKKNVEFMESISLKNENLIEKFKTKNHPKDPDLQLVLDNGKKINNYIKQFTGFTTQMYEKMQSSKDKMIQQMKQIIDQIQSLKISSPKSSQINDLIQQKLDNASKIINMKENIIRKLKEKIIRKTQLAFINECSNFKNRDFIKKMKLSLNQENYQLQKGHFFEGKTFFYLIDQMYQEEFTKKQTFLYQDKDTRLKEYFKSIKNRSEKRKSIEKSLIKVQDKILNIQIEIKFLKQENIPNSELTKGLQEIIKMKEQQLLFYQEENSDFKSSLLQLDTDDTKTMIKMRNLIINLHQILKKNMKLMKKSYTDNLYQCKRLYSIIHRKENPFLNIKKKHNVRFYRKSSKIRLIEFNKEILEVFKMLKNLQIQSIGDIEERFFKISNFYYNLQNEILEDTKFDVKDQSIQIINQLNQSNDILKNKNQALTTEFQKLNQVLQSIQIDGSTTQYDYQQLVSKYEQINGEKNKLENQLKILKIEKSLLDNRVKEMETNHNDISARFQNFKSNFLKLESIEKTNLKERIDVLLGSIRQYDKVFNDIRKNLNNEDKLLSFFKEQQNRQNLEKLFIDFEEFKDLPTDFLNQDIDVFNPQQDQRNFRLQIVFKNFQNHIFYQDKYFNDLTQQIHKINKTLNHYSKTIKKISQFLKQKFQLQNLSLNSLKNLDSNVIQDTLLVDQQYQKDKERFTELKQFEQSLKKLIYRSVQEESENLQILLQQITKIFQEKNQLHKNCKVKDKQIKEITDANFSLKMELTEQYRLLQQQEQQKYQLSAEINKLKINKDDPQRFFMNEKSNFTKSLISHQEQTELESEIQPKIQQGFGSTDLTPFGNDSINKLKKFDSSISEDSDEESDQTDDSSDYDMDEQIQLIQQ